MHYTSVMHFITIISYIHNKLSPTGADFVNTTFTYTVQDINTELGIIRIELNNITYDDDIDEFEQSFVLVAEIGDDVPDSFACFQRQVGETDCFNRTGATEIRIMDNDGM